MQVAPEKKRRISADAVERALDAIETQAEISRSKNKNDRAEAFEYSARELRKAIADG